MCSFRRSTWVLVISIKELTLSRMPRSSVEQSPERRKWYAAVSERECATSNCLSIESNGSSSRGGSSGSLRGLDFDRPPSSSSESGIERRRELFNWDILNALPPKRPLPNSLGGPCDRFVARSLFLPKLIFFTISVRTCWVW